MLRCTTIVAGAPFALGLLARPNAKRAVSYYDREAGIVFVRIAPLGRHGWRRGWRRRYVEHSEDRGWGLIGFVEGDEQISIELWRPKEMLPADLLDALPQPTRTH